MAAVTIHSDFGAQENSLSLSSFSPICLSWSLGTRWHGLHFLNIVLSQLFHSHSFIFIKKFFSSSSLSASRVVSSVYLRFLIFLPAILIPACASSSLAFLMMYSAHKLSKQGDNIQPWRTPFPVLNQYNNINGSSSSKTEFMIHQLDCSVLTAVSVRNVPDWKSVSNDSVPALFTLHVNKVSWRPGRDA